MTVLVQGENGEKGDEKDKGNVMGEEESECQKL